MNTQETNGLLEALKKICKVAPSYIKNPDDELDNAICEAMLAVYDYEQTGQMTYSDYIRLGFARTDFDDSVEFDNTGYHGYVLVLNVSSDVSIIVDSKKLDSPYLVIDDETLELKLSDEQVRYISEKVRNDD